MVTIGRHVSSSRVMRRATDTVGDDGYVDVAASNHCTIVRSGPALPR